MTVGTFTVLHDTRPEDTRLPAFAVSTTRGFLPRAEPIVTLPEEFDALVVAIDWDAVHVPDIKGLDGEKGWSNAKDRKDGKYVVWHSQAYRRPEPLANKVCFSLLLFD